MNERNLRSAIGAAHGFFPAVVQGPARPEPEVTEHLPFTIRLVEDESDLYKAIRIRHSAYARHLPELGEKLKEPEAMDYDSDVAVLLAESKLDGSPLGTARVQMNHRQPLCVEQSVALPDRLHGLRLAEVTRLGVEHGRVGRLVKLALFKALFLHWEHNDLDWAIAAGRDPIDRQYTQLLFEDLYPERGFIPLRHAGDIPHRVMAFEVATAYTRWTAANHPLKDFVFHTHHPDISVARNEAAPLAVRPPVQAMAGVAALA
ncbi:MAG TPA: hypothetical protein VEC35_05705 [Noviherbaspirillum sp.]|nr:hypothetical protein [Noviherbaspirillum sp.]